MNRQSYRIIFNKARGMLMAVAETTKSRSKASSQSRSNRQTATTSQRSRSNTPHPFNCLGLSILLINPPLVPYAHAANTQIKTDPTASIFQRPTLLVADNGTPIVNIRSTNTRNISRNSYSQLDIGDNGVILNNSPFGTDTQLAGNIRGNFWLMARPANIIINEVNSTDPSIFNGKLEVAGRSADVIIANPSGINVNGGEVINAGHTILTTGRMGYDWLGNPNHIQITQGNIHIGEQGFNRHSMSSDYPLIRDNTLLLAKSVEMNGKLTGNEQGLLQIVVGSNEIDYANHTGYLDDKHIHPIKDNTPTSEHKGIALNVSQLGGAYAQGIHILGTDQGMGVTNAGVLSANRFIHINNQGRIENHGSILAGGKDQPQSWLNLTNQSADHQDLDRDIVNTGTLQAGSRIQVNSAQDLISHGKITRTGLDQPLSKDSPDGITLLAQRDLLLQHIDNNQQGDLQLLAKHNLSLIDAPKITTKDNIQISAGHDVTLNNTHITSIGDAKSVSVHSGNDLTLKGSTLNVSGKQGKISSQADHNQSITSTDIRADSIHTHTGDSLTVTDSRMTSTGKDSDLKLIAGTSITANQLHATAQQGSVILEAAKANLLAAADSDINLTDSTLNASKNTDIIAERHIKVSNTHLTADQIRGTAGGDLQLALTGDNTADTHVYLKAGDKLTLSTHSDKAGNAGKLTANQIEAMAAYIEVGDNSKLTAKAGDIKLSSIQLKPKTDDPTTHAINLGKNADLTASHHIALNTAQGKISATDLHGRAGNSISLIANKGIDLKSEASNRHNHLTAITGDIVLIDQEQTGIAATNLNLNADQGKAHLQSLGNIDIQSTPSQLSDNQTRPIIHAQAVSITNVPTTADDNNPSNKPHGHISVQATDITASQDGLIINSNDTLRLSDNSLNAIGNLELHSNQATFVDNVKSNSQQHTAISSATNLDLSASHITSKGILSVQAKQDTSVKDSQLQGGALLVAAKKGNLDLGNNLTLTTKTTDLLANDSKLSAINGSLTVKGNNDLVYDAGKTLHAEGDLDLRTTGKLSFQGTPGKQGNGSETNVKVTAKGNIGLTGSTVEMLGSHVSSTQGGIAIAATQGNIKVSAIINTIDGVKPENRLKELADNLAKVNDQITVLANDSTYQTAANAKQIAQQKLDKLIKDNAATPITDFEQQKTTLTTQIATQRAQLQQRSIELGINKTHEELSADKAALTRSRQIADTPYQGIEHAGSQLNAKGDIHLTAKGGIAIEASDIHTQGKATLQSLTHLGDERIIIDEKARADLLVPLMQLNKLTIPQKQDHLTKQLTAIDRIRFSSDETINPDADTHKIRHTLKQLLPIAMAGDLAAKAQIDQILTENPPITTIPVAISIEGLNDIYERGNRSDDSYSLHNNNRPANIIADKGILIQATGADNTDPSKVTTTGAPNNILLGSGDFIAKDGDIAISSVGNIILQAAQDSIYDAETQTSKRKRWGGLKNKVTITTTTEDIRSAEPVTLIGNNIYLNAADNIYAYATQFKAAKGATHLHAGDAIRLMAVEEINRKEVDVTKTSRFIGIRYNKDHSNDTRSVSSELPSKLLANIITTQSGDDTYLQGTQFEYLQAASIKAGVGIKAVDDAKIIFDTINTTVKENHSREFNNVVWQSMSEKGFIDETGTLPKFDGPTLPSFSAPGGLIVQVPLSEKEKADSTHLVNVINRMGSQPGFEYLQEIAKRSDVDFSVVQLAQQEWDYKQEGLTPAGAALLALAVTAATGGMGASFLGPGVGTITVPTAAGGTTIVTTVAGASANAAFSSLAAQASVALINNKGDVKKTLRDLASSETAKQLAFAAATAGMSAKLDQTVLKGFNTDSLNDRFIRGIVNGTSNALVDSAVNGTNLEEALKSSLRASIVDAGTGYVFTNAVKGLDSDALVDNIAHKLAAGLVGCASAELNKQSCEAGALGAAVGEMVGDYLTPDKKLYLLEDGTEVTEYPFYSQNDLNKIHGVANITSASLALLLGLDVNTVYESSNLAVTNNTTQEMYEQIMSEEELLWELAEHDPEKFKKLKIETDSEALEQMAMVAPIPPVKVLQGAAATGKAVRWGSKVFTAAPTIKKYQGVSQSTLNKMNDIIKWGKNTTQGKASKTNIDLPKTRCPQCDFNYLASDAQKRFTSTAGDGSLIEGAILKDGSKVQIRTKSTSRPNDKATIELFKPQGKGNQSVMELRYPK